MLTGRTRTLTQREGSVLHGATAPLMDIRTITEEENERKACTEERGVTTNTKGKAERGSSSEK